MPANTSRLALPYPVATDGESAFPLVSQAQMTAMDASVLVTEGTLALRPVPSSVEHNHVYRTTDTGGETLAWSDGSVWLPLGLIPASTSSSSPVLSGQALITTGSSALTVTLPAAAQGAMCAVINRTSNVTTVSGSNIQGVGLSSALSFPLGAAGASAVLISDGTNWNIVSGQQDTGWVALTLSSGIVTQAGGTASVRLVGSRVYLRGVLKNNTGGSVTTGTQVATIPAGASGASAPSYNPTVPVLSGATGTAFVSVQGLAVYYIGASSWATSSTLDLSPVTYDTNNT